MTNSETDQVTGALRKVFTSASDIYVDTETKECEAKISVDEFRGDITERLFADGVQFKVIDFWDTYPFKYVLQYHTNSQG
ncbi:MAG: hypothetical protein EOM83_13090 [Clostridia bacterium]|nr:hypothetical protein [Clostridia bacterium]